MKRNPTAVVTALKFYASMERQNSRGESQYMVMKSVAPSLEDLSSEDETASAGSSARELSLDQKVPVAVNERAQLPSTGGPSPPGSVTPYAIGEFCLS